MSRNIRLAPLADKIVAHTPARSYANRLALWMNLTERNSRALKGSYKALEIMTDMVEARLITRDGVAYAAPEDINAAMSRMHDELNRALYPNGRGEAAARLDALAGVTADGHVAPTQGPVTIDRAPSPWWRNLAAPRDQGVTSEIGKR